MDQTPAPGQPAPLTSTPLPSAPSGLPRPSISSGLAMTGGSAGHPEVKAGLPAEALAKAGPEIAEIEVIPESPEISPELAEHVERVVRGEIELPGPIEAGTHEGRPVSIQPSAPQQPNIVLPLTRGDFTAGPNKPVSSSWRWLYEFVKRIILMMPGRAIYREN